MSAQTAKRRRRQASNNYRHMSPMSRPKYHKKSEEKSLQHEARKLETERRMRQKSR